MTDPITPPPELIDQWHGDPATTYDEDLLRAAQWGADQELEACCEVITSQILTCVGAHVVTELRVACRPKPPSLKQQALDALKRHQSETWCKEMDADIDTIRQALETLPND